MSDKNKNIVIAVLLGVLVVMAVAYAAFSTTLNINGTATIKSSWNVAFDTTKTTTATGVVTPTTGSGGTTAPTGTVSYTDGQHATVSADLYQPGDKVEFLLTVKNTGSLKATLGSLSISSSTGCTVSSLTCTSTAGHIKFTVGNFSSATLNASNGTATIKVTAEFVNGAVTNLSGNESASITVSFTATQATS